MMTSGQTDRESLTFNRPGAVQSGIWLYRYSLLVAFSTLLLIAAGGLVTSHEAGLAVPDWPTSYGRWFPPMVGNVFWEHGHRMIAAAVGILTVILAVWVQLQEKRKGIRILGWITAAAVFLQALLGGLTVIYLLPAPVSIAHACLAQTFFCLTVALAYFLKPAHGLGKAGADSGPDVLPPSALRSKIKRLLILTAGFVYLQLILGATLRHTGYGVTFHILMAFLILIHVLLIVLKVSGLGKESLSVASPAWISRTSALARQSLVLGTFTLVQIFLGIGAFIFTRLLRSGYSPSGGEVFFATSHQTLGALILAILLLMILRVYR